MLDRLEGLFLFPDEGKQKLGKKEELILISARQVHLDGWLGRLQAAVPGYDPAFSVAVVLVAPDAELA